MLSCVLLTGVLINPRVSTSSAVIGLLAGFYGVAYGLWSREFVFHGRFGTHDPERSTPSWQERALVVSVSALVALGALFKLLKIF